MLLSFYKPLYVGRQDLGQHKSIRVEFVFVRNQIFPQILTRLAKGIGDIDEINLPNDHAQISRSLWPLQYLSDQLGATANVDGQWTMELVFQLFQLHYLTLSQISFFWESAGARYLSCYSHLELIWHASLLPLHIQEVQISPYLHPYDDSLRRWCQSFACGLDCFRKNILTLLSIHWHDNIIKKARNESIMFHEENLIYSWREWVAQIQETSSKSWLSQPTDWHP